VCCRAKTPAGIMRIRIERVSGSVLRSMCLGAVLFSTDQSRPIACFWSVDAQYAAYVAIYLGGRPNEVLSQ